MNKEDLIAIVAALLYRDDVIKAVRIANEIVSESKKPPLRESEAAFPGSLSIGNMGKPE